MSWRENRDLLFWYYVAWAIFWAFIVVLIAYAAGAVHVLMTQGPR